VGDIASALVATIRQRQGMPVTVSASSGTVNFTARNKGPCGNDIDLRVNYLGTPGGETIPQGMTYTINAMAGGATAPGLSAGLEALGDMQIRRWICMQKTIELKKQYTVERILDHGKVKCSTAIQSSEMMNSNTYCERQ
jgi:phage tail sheath gpL-like